MTGGHYSPLAHASKALRTIAQVGLIALGVALGILFGWLAIREVDWGAVGETIVDVPVPIVIGAVALMLLSAWVRAFRWRLMWKGQSISTFRLFQVENAAIGINNVSPVRLFDEVASLGMVVVHDRLPAGATVATIVMTRALDLIFTLGFIAICILVVPELTDIAGPVASLSIVFILLLLAVLNLGTLVRIFPPLAKLPGVTSFRDAIGAMWADKRLLAGTFSATVAYWLILGPLGYLLGTNMGIELHAFQFTLVVLGAIFFATTIPGLPGAAGTFEFAVVYLLNLWEVPQATALGFGVILHLVLFLPPVLIAAVVLPREGFVSVRAFRERARAVREKRGAEGPSGV